MTRKQIQAAGPRYTPRVETGSPNLQIPRLVEALDALMYSDGFRKRVGEMATQLSEAWSTSPGRVKGLFRGRLASPAAVSELLNDLSSMVPALAGPRVSAIARVLARTTAILDRRSRSLIARSSAAESDEARRDLDRQGDEIRRLRRQLQPAIDFGSSIQPRLLTANRLLILGEWGTGKTHLLCDIASRELAASTPVLLVLAHSLPESADPLDAFLRQTHIAADSTDLFRSLNALGQARRRRLLVMIDALNEGDRNEWRRIVGRLAATVSPFPYVGLVVSCRSPFDRLIFGKRSRSSYVSIVHHGFEGVEFDAHIEFFSYWRVSLPDFPLLAEEFARPLFLKMLCKMLAGLAAGRQRHQLRNLASGQKGMTYVVEHFALEIGSPIETAFGLPPKSIWSLLKGPAGFAAEMAEGGTDSITRQRATEISGKHLQLSHRNASRLVSRLATDGLLVEDLRLERASDTPQQVVRFSYQRFSDHLIARHLLDRYLNKRSVASVRRSFYRDRRLGKLFELNRWGSSIAEPGLGVALMVEFPERLKPMPSELGHELVFYLPSRLRLARPLMEVFLSGLHWRSAASFSRATDRILDFYARQRAVEVIDQVYKTLVVLAARPGHRYSAAFLKNHLAGMTLADRDLVWTEHIRRNPEEIDRLVDWQPSGLTSRDSVQNLTILLGLVLTTNRRAVRDRATRALFRLGLRHPQVLLDGVIASFEFDDPYVRERLLAAAYGIAMNLCADPAGDELRAALPRFANQLLERMFRKNSPHATTHGLIAGYAAGLLELALTLSPADLPRGTRRLVANPIDPSRSMFRPPDSISDAEVESTKSVLGMDFENYTLGQLIRNRSNYDFQHVDYQKVRRQILGRVADLGYSAARFGEVDSHIARFQPFGGNDIPKTDRYGKKYAWIAYFEMYGLRSALSLTDEDRRYYSRSSDTDIDPSFPPRVRSWLPEPPVAAFDGFDSDVDWLTRSAAPDYPSLLEVSDVDGVEGPWILLEGYLSEVSPNARWSVYSIARALVLKRAHLAKFSKLFLGGASDLNNFVVPGPQTDHYIYAGEIPWSWRYDDEPDPARRSRRRDIRNAFEGWRDTDRGVPVEVLSRTYGWESYHSSLNQAGSIAYAAPSFCARLQLRNRSGTTDLFDLRGRQATIYREGQRAGDWRRSSVLFARRDLIDVYLRRVRGCLAWVSWGERRIEKIGRAEPSPEIQEVWQRHEHLHKTIGLYAGPSFQNARADRSALAF